MNEINNRAAICHSCQLEWSKEFMNKDNQGRDICMNCGEKPKESFKSDTFICEFCYQTKIGHAIFAHVKNMPDKRNSREISKLCSYCSYARAKKENFYCPRFSSGRDSWDANLPEFDCFCERKKY